MADRITRREIKKLPVVPYSQIRGELETGERAFGASRRRGRCAPSLGASSLTLAPLSHPRGECALARSKSDARRDIVRSARFQPRLAIARVRNLKKKNYQELAKFGIQELARPYDTAEIARIVARIIAGRGRKTRDNEYICSELVYECFLRAGIEFKYDKRGFISPKNIWEDPRVEIVGRVV